MATRRLSAKAASSWRSSLVSCSRGRLSAICTHLSPDAFAFLTRSVAVKVFSGAWPGMPTAQV
jgi:hypothetical protein